MGLAEREGGATPQGKMRSSPRRAASSCLARLHDAQDTVSIKAVTRNTPARVGTLERRKHSMLQASTAALQA